MSTYPPSQMPTGPQQPWPGWQQPLPPVQQPTNPLATSGFVTSLIGAILALVPLLGIVSWIICPIGICLAIAGFVAAGSRQGVGRTLAGVGIGLGVVGLIICVVWAVGFAAAVNSSSSTRSASAPSYSASSSGGSSSGSGTSGAGSSESLPAGTFGQGTYEVGTDIQPGRYKTSGASEDSIWQFCMASREKADGSAIGFPETTNTGPAFIEVKASDAQVTFSGECTWTRQG